jgi:hypothetical protein
MLVLGAVALAMLVAGRARAEFTITFAQQGANVVATGTGSIDLTDLILAATFNISPEVAPQDALIAIGPFVSGTGEYTGISGPASFGPGISKAADSSTGSTAFRITNGDAINIGFGYTSGSVFTSSATFSTTTISGLGLTPGTYTYTWGSGADADDVKVIIPSAVPEPGSLSLFGVGALAMLGVRHWRKRKQTA